MIDLHIGDGQVFFDADVFDADAAAAVAAVGGGVGLQGERPEADAVERVCAVSQVARVSLGVVRVVRPEVQVVLSRLAVGRFSERVAAVFPASVGALQIDQGAGESVLGRGEPFDVPDEQAFSGDMAVVVVSGARPVLEQEEFLAGQGQFEDRASQTHILQADLLGNSFNFFQFGPAEFDAAPGTEAVRAVIPVPARGAPAHQAPAADAGGILLRSGVFPLQKLHVVEVGQAEDVAVFVAHRAGGFGKGAAPLNGAQFGEDADGDSRDSEVVGDVRFFEPEIPHARGSAQEKVLRSGGRDDEQGIDRSVVVAGVGKAVRAVAVVEGEIDVAVGLAEDLQGEAAVVTVVDGVGGEIGGGGSSGCVDLWRDFSTDLQLAERHRVVEVGEAARLSWIEDLLTPGGDLAPARLFVAELGEEDEGAARAFGVGLGEFGRPWRDPIGVLISGEAGAEEGIGGGRGGGDQEG